MPKMVVMVGSCIVYIRLEFSSVGKIASVSPKTWLVNSLFCPTARRLLRSAVDSASPSIASYKSEREFAFVFHVEQIQVGLGYPAATPRGLTLPRMNSMMESIGVPG